MKSYALKVKLSAAYSAVPSGAIYRHYKGGIYEVLGHAIDTDSTEVRVVYHRIDGPDFNFAAEKDIEFCRNISEWYDIVDHMLGTKRFTRVTKTTTWTAV